MTKLTLVPSNKTLIREGRAARRKASFNVAKYVSVKTRGMPEKRETAMCHALRTARHD